MRQLLFLQPLSTGMPNSFATYLVTFVETNRSIFNRILPILPTASFVILRYMGLLWPVPKGENKEVAFFLKEPLFVGRKRVAELTPPGRMDFVPLGNFKLKK